MQTQPGQGRIRVALVQDMHPQPVNAGQVAEVLGWPRVIGHIGKRRIGRAQSVFSEGMGVHSLGLEKVFEQLTARLSQHTTGDLRLVVQLGMVKQVEHRARHPGARVRCTKHHAVHPGVQQGAAAHGAGLQRHIERAAVQAVIAQHPGRFAQRHHFGMRRGVVADDRGIAARRNHSAVFDHHRAHGHFACCASLAGLLQGQAHPVRVLGGHVHAQATMPKRCIHWAKACSCSPPWA